VHSWTSPAVPELPGLGSAPLVYDAAARDLVPSVRPGATRAGIYVCGITPYDATHLGHAATYLAFDLLVRAWLDAGLNVDYVQCVTDVDDPLLARAAQTGQDWRALAASQMDLYRADMAALRVIAPAHLPSVAQFATRIADAVARLVLRGWAYGLPAPEGGQDIYADLAADPDFGAVAGLDQATMESLFAERGGDPDRPGKRSALDPLLWRARRAGEPWWETGLGPGRPGWHIECAVFALDHLGVPFDVQGGGEDLVFPHHEMSTSHLRGLSGEHRPIAVQAHAGLIGFEGEKMSKSRGNLVFVSRLLADGADPMAIRLALLGGHYRCEREWDPKASLLDAQRLLQRWRSALGAPPGQPTRRARPSLGPVAADDPGLAVLAAMRQALANDLDGPQALAAVNDFVLVRQRGLGGVGAGADRSAGLVRAALDGLLGIVL